MTALGIGLLILFGLLALMALFAVIRTMFSSAISRREERWREVKR